VGAAEAWQQGGAILLLVVFVAAGFAYLKGEIKARDTKIATLETRIETLITQKEDLYKGSVTLLQSYQSRDQEDLRASRERERRILEARQAVGSQTP
jgi:hypothetical protein